MKLGAVILTLIFFLISAQSIKIYLIALSFPFRFKFSHLKNPLIIICVPQSRTIDISLAKKMVYYVSLVRKFDLPTVLLVQKHTKRKDARPNLTFCGRQSKQKFNFLANLW